MNKRQRKKAKRLPDALQKCADASFSLAERLDCIVELITRQLITKVVKEELNLVEQSKSTG